MNGIFIEVDTVLMVDLNGTKYPIYDKDLGQVKDYPILIGDTVEFEIVDEFTHPQLFTHIGWGDAVTCAKLNLEKYA